MRSRGSVGIDPRVGRALWATLTAAIACGSGEGPVHAPAPPPVIRVTARDNRFVVREHMLAAIEMQLSGEPFASAMGRTLSYYSRDYLPPDLYFDHAASAAGPVIDLAGFSSAIESYEYSKQPMNNLAFESGAGLSLVYGPLMNPTGSPDAGCAAVRDLVQHLGLSSNAEWTAYFITGAEERNPFGWPGIWPTYEPFVSFDPSIDPTSSVSERCSITSDDDPGASGALLSDDYECDATELHLPRRASQVESAVSPGSSGWAGWKSALWVMNYLQVMHDQFENPVAAVLSSQVKEVGHPGNAARAREDPKTIGVYLGSSNIEGFQAGVMIAEQDNAAADWLLHRATTDGATLGGFPDVRAALAYDTTSPLHWFPARIAITEEDRTCVVAGTVHATFPQAAQQTVADGGSRLLDLAGLLGAYASFFALTDTLNADVGGSQPALAYFDGDPFPVQGQVPSGADTLHDRALALMRVALVNLQRMHVDPATGVPVDDVTVTGGVPARSATIDATSAAYTLLALRTVRRALTDQLTLYSNTKPDTAAVVTPIDRPLGSAARGPTVTSWLNADILALARLFYDKLTDATGRALPGWNVSRGEPTSRADLLDAHTAAVRGLLIAYLATGDATYRDRALLVFERVESAFWDPVARIYRPIAGDRSSRVTYTPVRFALVQAALRDTYELAASLDGQSQLASLILDRVARMNKLVLNGWDDRNGNQKVDYPEECVFQPVARADDPGGGFSKGGLQMAERALSGETGSVSDTFDAGPRVPARDREHDCVPEISAAHLPSALADSITFDIEGAP